MSLPVLAVVLVPAIGHIAQYTTTCLDYCATRGYEVVGVVAGNWPAAAAVVMNRQAQVLVVADADHLDPHRQPRLEIVADAAPRRAVTNGRYVDGRLPRDRVRELIDGPGEVTVPVGVDPGSIAAMRRIARRLADRP